MRGFFISGESLLYYNRRMVAGIACEVAEREAKRCGEKEQQKEGCLSLPCPESSPEAP